MTVIALSGGCIVSRRISECDDPRFLATLEILRRADVAFGHLEGPITSGEGPETYPAAEAGWTWIANPPYFAEELVWAGYDIVSHASNHAADYMYGGLRSSWAALKAAGLPFAGTGESLTAARRPAYVDGPGGRVALVSASSSTPDWARAADPLGGKGTRPGVNQVRMLYRLDAEHAAAVKRLAQAMGWWITEVGDQFLIHPAGLHNTVTRFQLSSEPGVLVLADRDDVAANLASLADAKKNADLVIFHLHNHEWDPQLGLSAPPAFVRQLARDAIDAAADVVIVEGAHAMLRGMELYRGKPVFYDPGDLFKDGNSRTRPLAAHYWLQGRAEGVLEVTTAESRRHTELAKLPTPVNPSGGYNSGPVLGVVIPVCRFARDGMLESITIHPARHLAGTPTLNGLPGIVSGEEASEILGHFAALSAAFGTQIKLDGDVAHVRL